MLLKSKSMLSVLVVVGLLAIGTTARVAIAGSQAPAAAPAPTPAPQKVAAGETEAKKLLLLMDTDKNGKVSRAEFMAFMAAEFDRLDVNHDGELDLKELEKSQLVPAHRGGTRR